ncbi:MULTISPECIES: thioredoxin family protein [unclassified Lentimicrobium]|uniref:thioredoxin family protein n=1 Tax=unclassified Lentimicrobium TaxID=2677434 RepID=UPI001555675B|nr:MULTISPECIES: thioredoxin family protein [unclassified Lentimicrobium]NPD47430.1 thioredoxin family protein [Lentimicrobium sp. S6]NPD85084.1 thioredoxin family protein [Lentimicrobium sp. L6]
MDFNTIKPANKEILILGTGCAKCKTLEKLTREVVAEEGIDAQVSKVEDIVEIMQYGVMSTPGLVVDKQVVMSGKLPSKKEIIELLNK